MNDDMTNLKQNWERMMTECTCSNMDIFNIVIITVLVVYLLSIVVIIEWLRKK